MAGMKTETHALLVERNSKLDDSDVYAEIVRLTRREHRERAKIIALLAEVESRDMPREMSYGGLFDFCVRGLGLSRRCAWMRVQVSRACCRFPEVLDALADRRLTLSAAAKLVPHMTRDNCEKLIADCSGLSKRKVEKYLVQFDPKPVVKPGVRRVASVEPCQPGISNLRFAVGDEFMETLKRAAEVGGFGDEIENIELVLGRALETYLDKNDPERKQARRDKARAKKNEPKTAKAEASPTADRTVSREDRDVVKIRSDHQCEYVSVNGLRCRERSRVQVDHVIPFALGGPNDLGNLQMLCRNHNLLAAERCLGTDFMKRKIEAAQSERRRSAGSTRPGEYDPSLPPTPPTEQSTNPSLRSQAPSP